MNFQINRAQNEQIARWLAEVEQQALADGKLKRKSALGSEIDYGAIGGCLTFMFSPTYIGCAVKVRHDFLGVELDVTDYDSW